MTIVIIKANVMHYFSALFGKDLYMFRTDLLSIIRSLNTVFTAIVLWQVWQITIAVYTVLDTWWRTVNLSETCTVLYQIKFEKQCISLAFIIRIYHDARSSECQILYRNVLVHVQFPSYLYTGSSTHTHTYTHTHIHKDCTHKIYWMYVRVTTS